MDLVIDAFDTLHKADITDTPALDQAASLFADAIERLGVGAFLALVTRGAGRLAKAGGGARKARAEKPDEPRRRRRVKPDYSEAQIEAARREGIDPKWFKEDGSPDWPKNDGFGGVPQVTTLQPGERIDRYGGWIDDTGFRDKGSFAAPPDTPFEARSMLQSGLKKMRIEYEVTKPIPGVKTGPAAPWFGQPGGGTQYKLPITIEELIAKRYIVPVG